MAHVEMYTTMTCAYCVRAKHLLAGKGVIAHEIDVSFDRSEMTERTGNVTVPQILIDGHVVGGYDQLVALQREGRLDAMLAGEGDEAGEVEGDSEPDADAQPAATT